MSAEGRLGWPDHFLEEAQFWGRRSTCTRADVGAVIVADDNRVIATGYNGAPAGLPHCIDLGCDVEDNHCVRTIHAEENAIFSAARLGISTKGCDIYITLAPCRRCAGAIIAAGLREVHYPAGEMRGVEGLHVLTAARGVTVVSHQKTSPG